MVGFYLMDWLDRKKVVGMKVTKIEKLVGEYNIWELEKTPYAKFKIKIYVSESGSYSGYTNLQVADKNGEFYCGVGWGETQEKALNDTLDNFSKLLSRKNNWEETDFLCADPYDF